MTREEINFERQKDAAGRSQNSKAYYPFKRLRFFRDFYKTRVVLEDIYYTIGPTRHFLYFLIFFLFVLAVK